MTGAMHRIIMRTPEGGVNEFTFDSDEVTIGKDDDCDIVIKGWTIGKRHAVIRFSEAGTYIYSNNALIGIGVNGARIKEYGPLQSKDEIQIAEYSLYILSSGARSQKESAEQSPDKRKDVRPEHGHSHGHSSDKPKDVRSESRSSHGTSSGHTHVAAAQGTTHSVGARAENEARIAKLQSQNGGAAASHSVAKERPAPTSSAVSPSAIKESSGTVSKEENSQEPPPAKMVDPYMVWRRAVHTELLRLMDVRRTDVSSMSDKELLESTRLLINVALGSMHDIPPNIDRAILSDQVLHEAIGLGPLEPLLNDESVTEIMVNAHDQIFIERGGKIFTSPVFFSSDKSVLSAIERIVAPLGRKIDESSPLVDARLKDGSRVNAVIPPLALKGPCITIRKFSKRRLFGEDLINFDTLNEEMLEFLSFSVRQARNVVISGGTGSGKTTLLNILSNFIPDTERIVTVEDAAELRLNQPNLVSLEARPPNSEGKGAIPIRELVKNCLRMRPDRIVVGECRGGEALDMLQAMNTGHEGSMTTAHANTPRDMLSRVEVMVLMAGMDLPVTAIREQIASAIHLIVQQTRFKCGSRKITAITEVTGIEGGRIQLQDIFVFEQDGYEANGKVRGRYVATGAVPEFIEDLNKAGIKTPSLKIFEKPESGKPDYA